TNQIDTFTEKGIRLKDGSELEADIIVTATGLVLQVLGGLEVSVDGRVVDFAKTLNYKGMMYSDIPNLASAFGYTNASWTLKCDLRQQSLSLWERVGRGCEAYPASETHGPARLRAVHSRMNDLELTAEPAIDFTSGYVLRALHTLPRQGSKMRAPTLKLRDGPLHAPLRSRRRRYDGVQDSGGRRDAK